MKKLFLSTLFLIMFMASAFAADTKITALTADSSPTTDDLIVTVDDPSGTPANKKVTLANIKTLMSASPTLVTPALGTPSSGTLTNATGLPVSGITSSTSTALGVGSLELGAASDTTLSRSSAGVLAVEGVVIPSISSTNTLTNKTLTSPIISTISNTGTLTLPTSTDTLVGKATTDTFTNKTLDTAGTGNALKVGGAPVTAAEYNAGNSSTSLTINFANGIHQKVTLTGNCTFTFTAPATGIASLTIKLVQDGTGSRTVTWPASVKWSGATAPTLTTTATTGTDIIALYYDGTNYYANSLLDVR